MDARGEEKGRKRKDLFSLSLAKFDLWHELNLFCFSSSLILFRLIQVVSIGSS